MKLRGKLPPDFLAGEIFSRLPLPSEEDVILGPSIGEDAAILRVGDELLAIHSDPVTGGGKLAGWLSVFVASNDIATRGVRPRWLLPVFLFREGADESEILSLVEQVGDAARRVGASIVGGHTEVTPNLGFNIVVTTAMGLGRRVLNTRDAKLGDLIVLTKECALEGTAILSTELFNELKSRGIDEELLKRAGSFIEDISVLKESIIASKFEGVHSMHDPTEGGVLGGVQELAIASGLGFRIYEDRIPLREETVAICDALKVDPLKLISSGSLLIAVSRESVDELISALEREGVRASVIGELTDRESGMILLRKDGSSERISEPVMDELWRLLS
ncbi:AIR synthase [Candidatus Korarchaeum cryptofilum]|jgi:hydrogenase maturation factor|uniref:Hydrogenase maturation factor n=2 Tax=Candidatus Korarchaeum cryptofilum TaxID=498846 RepID=B1L3F6_KORCO|nr:AIR synthase family protein [Candidatus Korarchaeum cryptofilum]ACB06985.1 Hydrogenase maturation factor [Candidatus Korarchaeum cryptofilum OPF8]RSN67367.1 AIR synthase [Candidatus Korarchaeum cryptofilum]